MGENGAHIVGTCRCREQDLLLKVPSATESCWLPVLPRFREPSQRRVVCLRVIDARSTHRGREGGRSRNQPEYRSGPRTGPRVHADLWARHRLWIHSPAPDCHPSECSCQQIPAPGSRQNRFRGCLALEGPHTPAESPQCICNKGLHTCNFPLGPTLGGQS